jgi:hypothetical protein
MRSVRTAFVHEADLVLGSGTDPGAPGAAVTTELCGHWEHDGPCRWPHNNEIRPGSGVAAFRTLFISSHADEPEVRDKIERALRSLPGWSVERSGPREVKASEQPLALRLGQTPEFEGV